MGEHPAKSNRTGPISNEPAIWPNGSSIAQHCRGMNTRYKLAANYLAFVKLASIGLWRAIGFSA
jgi:hypothetical protein